MRSANKKIAGQVKGSQSLVDQNNFLSFWIWEYGVRHTEKNRKLFSALKDNDPDGIAGHLRDGEDELIAYSFDEPIGLVVVNTRENYFYYKSPTEMIDAFLVGNFKLINECRVWSPQGILPIGFLCDNPDKYIGDQFRKFHGLTKEQCRSILLNFIETLENAYNCSALLIPEDFSPNEIYNFITYERNIKPDYDEKGDFIENYDDESSRSFPVNTDELRAINDHLKRTSRASRINSLHDCKSRIIGLWLFDRFQELGGRRGAAKQAIEDFRNQFDNRNLGTENLDDADWRFYLMRTRACVEKGHVLPFSKKGD